MKTCRKLINQIRGWNKNEGGMEALQTVCLIAIAAVIMIAANNVGSNATKFMNGKAAELGIQDEDGKAIENGGAAGGGTAGGGTAETGSGN